MKDLSPFISCLNEFVEEDANAQHKFNLIYVHICSHVLSVTYVVGPLPNNLTFEVNQ